MSVISVGKGKFAAWLNGEYLGTITKLAERVYQAAGETFDSLQSAAWALARA